ncbi:MAG: heme NO-binding domain-containing protein, partial [Actinomycetota bacterium]|nr:heme NO-binding domain-containing protein [Actinomycetota bacterium]
TEEFGVDVWLQLLESAGAGGHYENTDDHTDDELISIVESAAALLELPVPQVLRFVGERIIKHMAAAYGHYFDAHDRSVDFFATLDHTIHWEVLSMYEGAEPPRFSTEDLGGGHALIEYSSRRGLPDLAEGMMAGVAGMYGEELTVERRDEVEDGRVVSVFQCHFRPGSTTKSGASDERHQVPWASSRA